MKSLKEHAKSILESSNVLKYNYDMFPYEWERLVKIVDDKMSVKQAVDDGDEIIYNENTQEVIARFDYNDNKVYTSIPKPVMMKAVLHRNMKDFDKYLYANDKSVNEAKISLGDTVTIIKGKHAGKSGTVEMILKNSVIVDIEEEKSTEEPLTNIK